MDPLLDLGRLKVWLRANAPELAGEVRAERIGEGQSCLTYEISGDGWRAILRRPPRGELPSTAFDVLREHRTMLALSGDASAVPVPAMYGACDDVTVIGAPFFVMEYVEGAILRDDLPVGSNEALVASTADAVIQTLVAIHRTNITHVGLDTLGPGTGYVERQVRRMADQWNVTRVRSIPEIDVLGTWLAASMPVSRGTTLVHGDYKLDNLILELPQTGSVQAVIDWEMATLGDPLADLGWLLYFWRERGEDPFQIPVCNVTDRPGFPQRRELIDSYARATETDIGDVTWYVALAGWKISIIMEVSYQRYQNGVLDHPAFARLKEGVPAMARRALELAGI